MLVKEVVAMLSYGEEFYIKGAHSGKIYYRSWANKKERLEKIENEYVSGTPFFTDLSTSKIGRTCAYPVIGIWMSDYYLCHPEEDKWNLGLK